MQPSLPSVVADRPGGRSEWMPSPTEHLHPASDRTKSVASTLAAPRATVRMRRFDGRFPGSRVLAFGHLPGFPVVSWPSACRLQLRGQPRIEAVRPDRVPFDPREGHCRPLDTVGMEVPSTGFRSPPGLQYGA